MFSAERGKGAICAGEEVTGNKIISQLVSDE
jgi:hypothetical protein